MRILHIDTGREMRGGQWQVRFLLEGLRGAGVESLLLCPPGSPLSRWATDAGFPVGPSSPGRVAATVSDFDLVHAHSAGGHTLGCLAANRPLVVSRRVTFPVKRGPLSRWKYGRACRYIAVSAFVKECLVDADIPPDKVSVVYDGVPELDPSTGGDRIVALDSTDPGKGTTLAKQAAAAAGVELHLVKDLRRGLRDAGVFLYLTDSEGLGSGALLAMSAGVPVIASRVGGLPEVLGSNEAGLLVENTPDAVRDAILELTGSAALRKRMGKAGQARMRARFSLDTMVKGTMEVYEEVCA